jgi:copper homeostasis protein
MVRSTSKTPGKNGCETVEYQTAAAPCQAGHRRSPAPLRPADNIPKVNQTRTKHDNTQLLEVCVESVDDAIAAAAAAHRIELNSALPLDGLTPSPGLLVETLRSVRIPVVAMARPRAGDFHYSASEFRVLLRDADFALEHGASAVAFGILTGDRRIDAPRCRQVIRRIRGAGRQAVFHRAFDVVADPSEALAVLIDLGITRVMTSGGHPTALDGAASIARLVQAAAGRIEILPAGGIRPANVRRVLARTGCNQVHTSLRDRTGRMSHRSLAALVRLLRSAPPRLRPR